MNDPIDLLNAHFDGKVLDEDQAAIVSRWVVADPANARTVVELGLIHSQADYRLSVPRFLDELGDTQDPAVQLSLDSALQTIEIDSYRKLAEPETESTPRDRRGGTLRWGAASVAAALLIGLFAVSGRSPVGGLDAPLSDASLAETTGIPAQPPAVVVEPSPVLATITETIEVVAGPGDRLRRGRHVRRDESLVIESGVLALTTSNGSEIVVEGPAVLRFDESELITLESGRLSARVEEGSSGLVVATPTARVVDLGTEFGVAVGPDRETNVAVYEGVVELYGSPQPDQDEGKDSEASKRISAGRSGYVDPDGALDWAVRTLPNNREFIRPDEIASLRKARSGSDEARQQVSFYAMQRTVGLMAFQSFDVPSRGAGYAISFRNAPRSDAALVFASDLQDSRLYSSGALMLDQDESVFLDIDTSSDSPFARASLLTDRGHIGRSGTELWLAWKAKAADPEKVGDHAGLSVMFGDQRLVQEPLFVGQSGGRPTLSVISNEGSRSIQLELDANPETFSVEPLRLNDQPKQWVMQLIFGKRGDKVAVWCDIPLEAIRETRPQAETVNANVMFDRLRFGVSSNASPWQFDGIVMATTLDAITEVYALDAFSL